MRRRLVGRMLAGVLAGALGLGMLTGCGAQNRNLETSEAVEQEEDVGSMEGVSGGDVSQGEASGNMASGAEDFDWEAWARKKEEERQAWFEGLTEEDYANAKNVYELTGDDWQQKTLVLLGELPEVSVKVYGEIQEGCLMILEHQGQRRMLYKDFLTPRAIMPEFCAYDYDGDGTQEIGMICYVGSGTGVALMDFSILDTEEDAFDTLYTMPYEEVRQACEQVTLSYEGDVLRIEVGDKSEEHSLAGTDFSGMPITGPALGDIVYFSFGESGEVICDVALALSLEDQVTPFFLGEMATMYDNGVVWENQNFRFYVHYDGKGGFEADGLTLAY